MKINSTVLTLLLGALPVTFASTNAKRSPGVLQLPVRRPAPATQILKKRQEVLPLDNIQQGISYQINISIGSPPQPVAVALDTGSGVFWVNPDCSTVIDQRLCQRFGKYTPQDSYSGFSPKNPPVPMKVSYGIGNAIGYYWFDNLILGDKNVNGTEFGIATSSNQLDSGIMGVAPRDWTTGEGHSGYLTIIDMLAKQGITHTRAFSLDLKNIDEDGVIIFGGMDTKRFSGVLEKLPIIPHERAPDGGIRYWVYMTSIGVTRKGESPKQYPLPSTASSSGLPVVPDSGTTLNYLPTELADLIVADFGANGRADDYYYVDCTSIEAGGTFDFGFGDIVIHVPFSDYFVNEGNGRCALVAVDDRVPLLGDAFLRAAYVVYDQDNMNVHLAPAINCSETGGVIPITGAVPSVTGGCGASSSSSSLCTTSKPTQSTTPGTIIIDSWPSWNFPTSIGSSTLGPGATSPPQPSLPHPMGTGSLSYHPPSVTSAYPPAQYTGGMQSVAPSIAAVAGALVVGLGVLG